MPRKIILDCDPGHDDAIALLLATGSPAVELLAVTTVAGNQTIAKVTHNALVTATVAGLSGVPVAAGCTRPLLRTPIVAGEIHGESGLDGPVLPAPTVALDPRHGVDLIIETVLAHPPGTVTLVPTGPLTNVALAARKEPRIVDRVAEVVLMGGSLRTGNRSPVSEFNIACDPEAAQIVFREPWPLTMVGLDLTHQALATPEVVARIAALATAPARFVADLLGFFGASYARVHGFPAPPVHDPCAVAFVIDAGVLTTRPTVLDVEVQGALTAGMTVADLRAPAPPGCHTRVAVTLDRERFWGLVLDALGRLGDP